MKALVGAAALLLAGGCGDGGGGAGIITGGGGQMFSCASYFAGADGGMGQLGVCLDATGATAQDVTRNQQDCEQQGNVFSRDPCPHDGSLGGCRETMAGNPLTLTIWYYDDGLNTDPSQIQQLCAGLASQGLPVTVTYVAP